VTGSSSRDPGRDKGSVRDHLMRHHRRSAREIDELPLEALHRFEHVEQTMGLIQLDHVHQQR
jgi:hypothetical protein